jgi:hypothetical protein
MEHSPGWEASSVSDIPEITHILWKKNAHHSF